MIVFYDHDGTLAANVLSPLKNTSDLLSFGMVSNFEEFRFKIFEFVMKLRL